MIHVSALTLTCGPSSSHQNNTRGGAHNDNIEAPAGVQAWITPTTDNVIWDHESILG